MKRDRQGMLFGPTREPQPPRERQPRRVMMHVIDAGESDDLSGLAFIARFECRRCGHETDWLVVENVTAGKRGLPCPHCNGGSDPCPS